MRLGRLVPLCRCLLLLLLLVLGVSQPVQKNEHASMESLAYPTKPSSHNQAAKDPRKPLRRRSAEALAQLLDDCNLLFVHVPKTGACANFMAL